MSIPIPRASLLPTPLPTDLRTDLTAHLLRTGSIKALRGALDEACLGKGSRGNPKSGAADVPGGGREQTWKRQLEERTRELLEERERVRAEDLDREEEEQQEGESIEEQVVRELLENIEGQRQQLLKQQERRQQQQARSSALGLGKLSGTMEEVDEEREGFNETVTNNSNKNINTSITRAEENTPFQTYLPPPQTSPYQNPEPQETEKERNLNFPPQALKSATAIVHSALTDSPQIVIRGEVTDGWVP